METIVNFPKITKNGVVQWPLIMGLSWLTILWLFNCRITAAVEGHNPPRLPGRWAVDNLASGIRLRVFKGGSAKDTFISRLVCHAHPTCRKYTEAIK